MNSFEILNNKLPKELLNYILKFIEIETNNLKNFNEVYKFYDSLQENLLIIENQLLTFNKKIKLDNLFNDFDYTGEIFSFRNINKNELVEYCVQVVDKEYGYNRIDIFKKQDIDFFKKNYRMDTKNLNKILINPIILEKTKNYNK